MSETTPPNFSETETTTSSLEDEVTQVKEATKALVEALKRLAETQIQSVSSLPKEVSQNIEQTVKDIQTTADKSWQTVIQQIGDIDERVMKAVKAAWEILSAPSNSEAANTEHSEEDPGP